MTSEFKFIGELPKSDKPWRMIVFGKSILCVNEMHPPHVIDGDQIRKLEMP